GIPMRVPALTINKVCLSGIAAIASADQLIRAGEFDVVVAGGQESMSRAPHMLTRSWEGFKYGDTTMRDHMAYDGLHDIFTDQAMGNVTESKNQGVTLTATTTQRRGANTTATTPQLQRQMQRDPRPGHPQRMPHRDRAT